MTDGRRVITLHRKQLFFCCTSCAVSFHTKQRGVSQHSQRVALPLFYRLCYQHCAAIFFCAISLGSKPKGNYPFCPTEYPFSLSARGFPPCLTTHATASLFRDSGFVRQRLSHRASSRRTKTVGIPTRRKVTPNLSSAKLQFRRDEGLQSNTSWGAERNRVLHSEHEDIHDAPRQHEEG